MRPTCCWCLWQRAAGRPQNRRPTSQVTSRNSLPERQSAELLTREEAIVDEIPIANIQGNISAQLTVESAEPSTFHQRSEFLDAFHRVDVFICPTLPFVATPLGETKVVIEDGVEDEMLSAIPTPVMA